jgi:hypothetical protein
VHSARQTILRHPTHSASACKNAPTACPARLLAAFEAAARHLSFTRAGAERFVTQSAMSRQIRALEDDLGVALFRAATAR